jgi:cysteine desulfurase/selenocysteine lyase|tara:strand:+ start:674 stop:1897 length:1224 start_codon:yes stop_codon:yes gene_type:complete
MEILKNIESIRNDFPILNTKVNGNQLIYFDNAATSQTPNCVIDSISDYYKNLNSNIHRGVHKLSQLATEKYEESRKKFKEHLNARSTSEIIFTSGTTHSINLISNGFTGFLKEGDEIIVSQLEHHSNIVPWQMLCEKTGAIMKVIPMNEKGDLDLSEFSALLGNKTKVVFVNHVSNALGTVNPIETIIEKSHNAGAAVLIDGAQAAPHFEIDVRKLDVDFYVCSAHKLCGPTGVGILYGKKEWLEKLPPYQGGGEMIDQVSFEKSTYADLPNKFEAGTPNISGVIASGIALDYINKLGLANIKEYEDYLLDYATAKLEEIDGIKIYGESKTKVSVISFNIGEIHPYDIGSVIDNLGIAVRTGHHCAQPIMDYFDIPGTIRISFSFYNTIDEINILIDALKRASKMLS